MPETFARINVYCFNPVHPRERVPRIGVFYNTDGHGWVGIAGFRDDDETSLVETWDGHSCYRLRCKMCRIDLKLPVDVVDARLDQIAAALFEPDDSPSMVTFSLQALAATLT